MGQHTLTAELISEDRRKLLVIMEDIIRRCELEALAVVTQSNAEEVAFFTDIDTNVDIFCALAASSLDTATKVTNKMNHGAVLELVVIGDLGYTIMSPVADQFILIGAGKDFYSLGKTILILREKVKEIPLTLTDKRATTTKRKACSHFCQRDELYCCVCSNLKENLCDICLTSIQQKQAEQKRILEEALERAKKMDEEPVTNEENITFAFTTEKQAEKFSNEEGQQLFNKVMGKISEKERVSAQTIKKPQKPSRTKKNVYSSAKTDKPVKKFTKKSTHGSINRINKSTTSKKHSKKTVKPKK